MRPVLAHFGLLIALSACAGEGNTAKEMPTPERGAPIGFEFDTSSIVDAPSLSANPPKKKSVSSAKTTSTKIASSRVESKTLVDARKVEIAVASAFLPAYKPEEQLIGLKHRGGGNSARAFNCLAGPMEKQLSRLIRLHKDLGWKDLGMNKKSSENQSFHARRKGYRLHLSLSQGDYDKCQKSAGKIRVSTDIFRLGDSLPAKATLR